MRNTGVAYLLWLLCFIGLFGIHRFYAGKWLTGLLWLFTFGFLLIGQIIDLFLIPTMVQRANIEQAHLEEEARQSVRHS
jgi:TM2 domain-containing membrane protein YozV